MNQGFVPRGRGPTRSEKGSPKGLQGRLFNSQRTILFIAWLVLATAAESATPLELFQQQLDATLDSLGDASGQLIQSNLVSAASDIATAQTQVASLSNTVASAEMTATLGKCARKFQKSVGQFQKGINKAGTFNTILQANRAGRKLKRLLLTLPNAGTLLILEELRAGSTGLYQPGQQVFFRVHNAASNPAITVTNTDQAIAVDDATWISPTDFYVTMGPDPGSAVVAATATTQSSRLPLTNGGRANKKAGPAPVTPANLTASAMGPTAIKLGWSDDSTDKTGFKIERAMTSLGPWIQINTTSATNYTDTAVLPLTTYFYRVRACNAAGNSAYTAVTSASTPDSPPAAPSGLQAVAVSSSQINLSWVDNSNNETGFAIERAPAASGPWTQITTVSAISYSDTGVSPATTYFYRVRAYNGAGNSAYSSVTSATTPDLPPAAPSSLQAVAVSPSQINLSWVDNSNNETGFAVERAPAASGPWTQITTVSAVKYSDTGLTAVTTYFYRVRAYNAAGNSAYTAVTSASTPDSPPAAPSNLQAVAASPSQINLSWVDNSNNETGFAVERAPATSGPWAQITTVTAASYSDTGLSAATTYFYRVRASNNAGNSAYTSTANASTPALPDTSAPSIPSGVTATAVASDQVNVSWNVATDTGGSGLAGYRVYRDGQQITTTTATSYHDTGRVPVTQYCYGVVAYDNAGNASAQSSQSCATTPAAPDTTAPTCGLTSPTGGTVSNTIVLSATASDNVGVTRVEFYRDSGVMLGTIASAPYNLTFDTTTLADGTHSFYAKAYDAAGNVGTSAANSVTVNNRPTTTVTKLKLVGFLSEVGNAHQVAVAGHYAYVAADVWGLSVVEVSNPSVAGSVDQPFDGSYVFVAGTRAYVTGQRWFHVNGVLTNVFGFYIIDISNPATPTLLGSLESSTLGFNGLAVVGNYAYVACGSAGVKVIDVSNAAAPALAGTGYDTPGWANNVTVSGSYAYVADGSMGLRILNISNPLAPTSAGTVDTPGSAYAVALDGSYAYIADSTSLQIANISNPSAPTLVGSANVGAADVKVSAGVAYIVASSTGLITVNVANPSHPVTLATLAPVGAANPSSQGVALAGTTAYVANGSGGLAIVNASNPSAPVTSAHLMDWFCASHVATKPGLAVVTGIHYVNGGSQATNGVRIISISDPTNLTVLGVYEDATLGFNGLAVAGNYAYIASGAAGLKVMDISNPALPLIVGTGYNTPGWANGVVLSGNYAYVADGSMGLRILDISNPLAPTSVGTVDTPGSAYAVALNGNYAYVADSTSLQIVNIANPASPVVVGSAPVGAADVKVQGTTVFAAASSGGVAIVNVANPASPVVQATFAPIGAANASTQAICVNGNLLYVANASGGVAVVDVTNPSVPALKTSALTLGDARDVCVVGGTVIAADSFSTLDTATFGQ